MQQQIIGIETDGGQVYRVGSMLLFSNMELIVKSIKRVKEEYCCDLSVDPNGEIIETHIIPEGLVIKRIETH